MSYFKTLQRAANGLSEAQPRPLSLYERSDAEWEIETDPLAPAPVAPDTSPIPAFAEKRQTVTQEPAPSEAQRNGERREESAASSNPQALAPLPQPARPVSPALDIAARPETKSPISPIRQTADPPATTALPPRSAKPVEQERPAPQHIREIEIRTERQIRVEAQPVAAEPHADERLTAPPQTVVLVPAVDAKADAEPEATPPLREAPAAPTLLIEIGQIDIRLTHPARAVPVQPARRETSRPVLSLDDYLRGRS